MRLFAMAVPSFSMFDFFHQLIRERRQGIEQQNGKNPFLFIGSAILQPHQQKASQQSKQEPPLPRFGGGNGIGYHKTQNKEDPAAQQFKF